MLLLKRITILLIIPVLKVRDKIKTILELKFESNAYLKKALPEMLKFLLRPGNILMSVKLLHENSDFIWKLSGDKSNDFSYYSKEDCFQ